MPGRSFGLLFLSVTLIASVFAPAAAAQQGSITGRVTDQTAGRPIAGARVLLVGTAVSSQTNADGRYRIDDVRAGAVTLRVSAIGYGAANRPITVAAGEEHVEDIVLALQPYSLDELVVTATGEQEKRAIGNVVNTIQADSLVMTRPISTMNDLLAAKTPGLEVLQGNLSGAGSRVRIRGTSGLSLNNEPMYIVDGVRMTSDNNSSSIGIGGTNPSRINDLNPEEYETVDVVKGPAAAALYGTAASTGVVILKSKRGRPGPSRWLAYAEQGFINDFNTYPNAYRGWRSNPTDTSGSQNSRPTNGTQCILTQVAARTCVQDSVTAYNLFTDPEATPNGTGYRNQYGIQVSGGSDVSSYFLSGEYENEVGQLKMPSFAVDSVLRVRSIGEVPFEQLRPNGRRRVSLRANVDAHTSPRLDLSVSTAFTSSNQRLPQTDNNTTGLLSNALGGPGNRDNGRFGYRAFTPNEFFAETVNQAINRFIGSGTMNWRPNNWLGVRATGGVDYTNRRDTDLCRRDECVDFGTIKLGFKEDNRTDFFSYTADATATATFQLNPTLSSRTTGGLQYVQTVFDRNGAFAEDLSPGGTTVDAGAIPSVDEVTDITKTIGAFIEQHMGYKERLFVTAALRVDDNSAFGASFKAVYYPKLGVSYVISEEPFFPKWSFVNSVRLRAAVGASGVQPGTTDALRFFAPSIARIDNADNPVIVFSSLGNDKLRPERAREVEIGGEAVLFNSRVNLDLTYYNKRTTDALIARILPPSAGVSVSRFENLGAVVNRGVEILAGARIIDRPSMGVELNVAAAYNTNYIADMGGVPPIVGTTTRQITGYPINGWWQRPYTFADADGNGIITANEITVADSAVFVGYANPRWEVIYQPALNLFHRRLRIVGLFDHKSGFYQLNGTERIRCESRLNCKGLVDPDAPLWEQARVVALRETPSRTQWGFIEKATFIRLRELAATYDFPDRWARSFGATMLSLTVAGRNVWKATGWSGMDPEANYFEGATGIVSNFQTAPPPTVWTFRLNVGF